MQLVTKPCCFCFWAGVGGTVAVHHSRSVTLRHFRPAACRFNLLAACSRAPSQIPPPSLELQALLGLQRSDYTRDLRPAKWGSGVVCKASILGAHVRFGSKADIRAVRFTPKADIG